MKINRCIHSLSWTIWSNIPLYISYSKLKKIKMAQFKRMQLNWEHERPQHNGFLIMIMSLIKGICACWKISYDAILEWYFTFLMVGSWESYKSNLGLLFVSHSNDQVWYVGFLKQQTCSQKLLPGGRLNKKDGLTRYGDSHVKDKTS